MTILQKLFLKYSNNYIGSIPYISHGGCGVAALATYLFLVKYNKLPSTFQVVTLYQSDWCDNCEEEYQHNMEFVEGIISVGRPCTHIAFMIDNVVMDTRQILDIGKFEKMLIIPKEKTKDFLETVVQQRGWNPDFDREKHVPMIEKKLKINLSLCKK